MRNLTIRRMKSFAGCLGTMKVYIEDPYGDLTIVNIRCRLLGTLKNGEEKSFSIDERSQKVFVIAGKMSRNYSNDYYQIPEGEEDILLTGRNEFNPATGNAFRFDGVQDYGVYINRQQATQKGTLIMVLSFAAVAVACVLVSAVLSSISSPKTFTEEEMSITLTDDFSRSFMDDGTLRIDSWDVSVFVVRDELPEEDYGDLTVDEYAQLILLYSEIPPTQIRHSDGLTYMRYSYEDSESGAVYLYFDFLYKYGDIYWDITFALNDYDLEEYESKIMEWAKSVEFAG